MAKGCVNHMHASIEGPSYAGKTTLLYQLAQNFNIEIIKGNRSYLERVGISSFPAQPKSYDEAVANANTFIKLEIERSKDVISFLDRGSYVVRDRSALSLIGYQSAIENQRSEYASGQFSVLELMRSSLGRLIEKGDVILPQKVLFLACADEDTHLSRVRDRGEIAVNSALSQWSFSQIFEKETKNSASELLGNTDVKSILSKNGDSFFKQNLLETAAFLDLKN